MISIFKIFLKIPLGLIYLYQKLVSPILPPRCRFTPTCSEYSRLAILRYGFKGLWLSVNRILRCHPWNNGGYDPVP